MHRNDVYLQGVGGRASPADLPLRSRRRVAPKPIPILSSTHNRSASATLPSSSPPYASYSRPRRDSLATSSPTSPDSAKSLLNPSPNPGRYSLSPRTLAALRRRDILHPSQPEGRTSIGRASVSFATPQADMTEEYSNSRLSSSAETTATSVFVEDCSEGSSRFDSVEHAESDLCMESRMVHFDNFSSLNGGSPPPSPRPSLLTASRKLLRLFGIKRRRASSSESSPSFGRTPDEALRLYPRQAQERLASLPATLGTVNPRNGRDTTELTAERIRVQEAVCDVRLERTAARTTLGYQLAPTSPIRASPLLSLDTSTTEPSDVMLPNIPEDEEEVPNRLTPRKARRQSATSYVSTGTSIAAYRSLFEMFHDDRDQVAPAASIFASGGFTAQPTSPASVALGSTLSASSPFDLESLADPLLSRRQLRFGPRPLEAPPLSPGPINEPELTLSSP